jgi:hypothetical protein
MERPGKRGSSKPEYLTIVETFEETDRMTQVYNPLSVETDTKKA